MADQNIEDFGAVTPDGNSRVLIVDGLGGPITGTSPFGGAMGDLLAANNLSDLDSFVTSRNNLGVAIGSDVQAYSANLDILVSNPLTGSEFNQLQNIDSVTITNTQWGYLGALDQALGTTDDVAFETMGLNSSGAMPTNTILKVEGISGSNADEGVLSIQQDGGFPKFGIISASDVAGERSITVYRRSRGTIASPAPVQQGDTITSWSFQGYGSAFGQRAIVQVVVDGPVSGSSIPLGFTFSTGTTTAVSRLVIGSDGGLVVGNPTGGSQGAATLNASAIYDDGVLICAPLNMDDPKRQRQSFWDEQVLASPVYGVKEIETDNVSLSERAKQIASMGIYTPKETKTVTQKVIVVGSEPGGTHRTAKRFFDMRAEGFDPRDPEVYFARMWKDKAVPGLITLDEWADRTKGFENIDKPSHAERDERTDLAVDCLAVTVSAMWDEIKALKDQVADLQAQLARAKPLQN